MMGDTEKFDIYFVVVLIFEARFIGNFGAFPGNKLW